MVRAYEPDSAERHRSVPIQDTITRIPGYPRKLVIFKIPASSYWWVRYYAESHIFKRTTKTEIKRDSIDDSVIEKFEIQRLIDLTDGYGKQAIDHAMSKLLAWHDQHYWKTQMPRGSAKEPQAEAVIS